MPFADYNAYLTQYRANQGADFQTNGAIAQSLRLGDCSRLFLPTPATPTTSVAYNKNSDRAINTFVSNAGTGRLSILGGRINPNGAAGVAVFVVDILNMSGGLNATLTTPQTTNLPTAALTRYTDGEGVHAALICHTNIGGTATTVTVEYTNSAGTGSRVSTAMIFGGSGQSSTGNMTRIPLQAGDTGMRSVESVTLAGTTGTAGNFGVVLYKPLAWILVNDVEGANVFDCVSTGRVLGQFNEVLDDACVSLFAIMNTAQSVGGAIILGEA
jgi:hypothetical protein